MINNEDSESNLAAGESKLDDFKTTVHDSFFLHFSNDGSFKRVVKRNRNNFDGFGGDSSRCNNHHSKSWL